MVTSLRKNLWTVIKDSFGKKGRLNAEGYFTLENSEKSKFLTANSGGIIPEIIADSLKITGNFETS